jgi:hypothetical protein
MYFFLLKPTPDEFIISVAYFHQSQLIASGIYKIKVDWLAAGAS